MGVHTRYIGRTAVRNGEPFRIEGLPPADYFAVALGDVQEDDVLDAEDMDALRRVAVRFSLRDGETKELTLKLVQMLPG